MIFKRFSVYRKILNFVIFVKRKCFKAIFSVKTKIFEKLFLNYLPALAVSFLLHNNLQSICRPNKRKAA